MIIKASTVTPNNKPIGIIKRETSINKMILKSSKEIIITQISNKSKKDKVIVADHPDLLSHLEVLIHLLLRLNLVLAPSPSLHLLPTLHIP